MGVTLGLAGVCQQNGQESSLTNPGKSDRRIEKRYIIKAA
jgi:hypothetical protein